MRKVALLVALLAPLIAGRSEAADPVTIRVGWITTPASLVPVMFAPPGVARHLNQTYRLDPQYFRASNLEVTAMAAGQLDIATLGYSTLPIAVENARIRDLRIIADETQDGVAGWYSLPYMVLKDGPIHAVRDLKGKVLATIGIGSGVYVAMTAVLQNAGLQEKRDYSVIETGFPSMKAMLLQGKADLVTLSHPFDDDPELLAKGRILFRSRDGLGASELSVWTARTPWLAQHKAAVTDLLEDYVRALRWYLDPANRQQAIAIIAAFTKQPPAQFQSWLFTRQDFYRNPNAYPNLTALQSNIDEQVKLGLLKASIDAKSYADLSLIHAAVARLGAQ